MADNDSGVRQRKKPPPSATSTSSQTASADVKESNRQPLHRRQARSIFLFFFAGHLLAAIYHPIQDCDEVFNYWEPTHYLTHGHGFQTWEYSPVYAIRSWAYIALHTLVTTFINPLSSLIGSKAIEFYLLRVVFGFVCAGCETRLFYAIERALHRRIALAFLLIMATSPGMFHASVAFLPSSFTMYTTMLGMAAFMESGQGSAEGIVAIGAGALLGWPFAAAMAIPFLAEQAILAIRGDQRLKNRFYSRLLDGSAATLLVLAIQVGVDTYFYRKSVIVPFNIVWYNIFSASGGPELYGTESWHFYLRNLFLNFHIWLVLALLSMAIVLLQPFLRAKGESNAYSRLPIFLSPFYLWLAIFTLQPHKEERFMYPAYPALALNAAVAVFITFSNFLSKDRKNLISRIPFRLRFSLTCIFITGALALSALRTIGTITAYNAPLSVYTPLHSPDLGRPGDTVCLGKEWYRFPSHFLLPPNVHAKFIKSDFAGLLPGEFANNTWTEPAGMNDRNLESLDKYIELKNCTFLVDLQLPSTEIKILEPNYLADTEHWERVKCLPFMDSRDTGLFARLGWIPRAEIVPEKYRRVYGNYCLLKRRKILGALKKDPVPRIENLG